MSNDNVAAELAAHFGEDGVPSESQWAAAMPGAADGPICILNLVKLRPSADYGEGSAEPARSGLEAFLQYGAGSTPRIIANGGTVVFAGPVQGQFVGADADDWDIGIVVSWPSRAAMISLFQDEAYRTAFPHRRAAVERYRATVLAAAG